MTDKIPLEQYLHDRVRDLAYQLSVARGFGRADEDWKIAEALFSKKCRQNWVFTNRTENRCRRAGRAYFRTNGYPKSY